MTNIFPIDFEEKLTMAQDDYILFSDSEDWNKIKKAQYSNLKWEQGNPGTAATIAVGSVSTLPAWSSVTVVNSWTSSAAVLDFGIPEWDTGATWPWATIAIWTTTTLPAWSSATVTNVWTSTDAILNFGIPKGDSGSGSWDVNWPASSTDWDVVVFDGATWKLIKDGSVALSTLSAWASAWATAVQPGDIGTAAACNTWTGSWNVPILDSNGKLNKSTLPGVALTDTYTVSTSSDLTTLSSAEQWDLAIVTTENKTYVLASEPYSTAANWKEILAPTGWVTSVNTQTWAVTLDADDISDSTTTNKFVTASDKTTWGNKQDALTLPATPTQWHLVTWGANNKTLVDWWVVPSGDVQISSQANNILTSWMKIWAWTQANYESLGTYDSNTLYLTV